MTDHVDVLVVGGGVVGLAVARALALAGRETMVVERNDAIGQEISSRNSGVIHSGIYYPARSLKARLCVQGRHLLYAYCAQREVPHRQCGKLIVAQASETPALERLLATARGNGVADLAWLDAAAARELEPQVQCAAALWSPSTGIVDVHELMNSLEGDLLNAGGSVSLRTELCSALAAGDGLRASLRSGEDSFELECKVLINCGGLAGRENAASISGYPDERKGPTLLAKGNYFTCAGKPAFRHLVYPMPGQAGLGVHATLDLAGRVRFGPDVEWIEQIDYKVDPGRAGVFYSAIRTYWPGLPDGALQPDYAGIRPKLVGPGEAAADFVIEDASGHGIRGLVNLLGIESPGLTSALAIGEYVRTLLDTRP
jgi:L-2-hydroxyglutarate oxidase LhgO